MSNQSAINLLRDQYKQSFEWLAGTMQGVTAEILHQAPGGNVPSIAGQVAHAIMTIDGFVLATVSGKPPVMAAGNSGVSETPPQGDWLAWGNEVRIDLPVFHEYAQAVFAAVDDYLASIEDSALGQELDLPFGKHSLAWLFNVGLLNTYSHTGEIAALKGLQGLKGYPM